LLRHDGGGRFKRCCERLYRRRIRRRPDGALETATMTRMSKERAVDPERLHRRLEGDRSIETGESRLAFFNAPFGESLAVAKLSRHNVSLD